MEGAEPSSLFSFEFESIVGGRNRPGRDRFGDRRVKIAIEEAPFFSTGKVSSRASLSTCEFCGRWLVRGSEGCAVDEDWCVEFRSGGWTVIEKKSGGRVYK